MRYYLTALVAGIAVFFSILALPVYGGSVQLYTLDGFVTMLIERSIIPEHMADKARELATFIGLAEPVVNPLPAYADSVEVSVSQLIEHSFRRYEEGKEIRGIILLAHNTSEHDIYPTAVRNCQITYSMYKDDVLVYNSATKNSCAKNELVSYRLGPGQTRMFEVRHAPTEYPLEKGSYRLDMYYPGYGEGSRTFTVE